MIAVVPKVYAAGDDTYQAFGTTINYMGSDYIGISPYYYRGLEFWEGLSINTGYFKNLNYKSDIVSAGYNLHILFIEYGGNFYIKPQENNVPGFTQSIGFGFSPFYDLCFLFRKDLDRSHPYYGISAKIGLPLWLKEGNKKYKFIF